MYKVLFFLALPLFLGCNRPVSEKRQSINPLIGDRSFEVQYGHLPDETTDDNVRITTHLSYVEGTLRQKNIDHLNQEMKEKRTLLLDLLHAYWVRGIYPRNFDIKDRRAPCFIDREGRICAVGYLIEQTAGRAVAEKINEQYQYDWIKDMKDERVEQWIAQSGLTLDEVAMIQPAYAAIPVGMMHSVVASGINGGLIALNLVQLHNGSNNKTVPILGMVMGAGQLFVGLAQTDSYSSWRTRPVERQQNAMAVINMGMGFTTALLSTCNLLHPKKSKDKQTQLMVYSAPTYNQSTAVGLSLRHKL